MSPQTTILMKRTIIKELVCLLGCLIAAMLLFGFVPDNKPLDINMHDTYMPGSVFDPNLSSTYFVFNYFIIIGLWAYLIRTVYFNFNEIITAILLLIFTGLSLIFLSDIIFVIHPPVFNAPLIDNTAPVNGLFYGGDLNSYPWGVRIIKMLLIFILAFTGFMVGRKWPKGIAT